MTKAINIKEAWPIVAAGAAVLLCIHRKKGKVSGIGAIAKPAYIIRLVKNAHWEGPDWLGEGNNWQTSRDLAKRHNTYDEAFEHAQMAFEQGLEYRYKEFVIDEIKDHDPERVQEAIDWLMGHDDEYRYRMLSRMKMDCEYYLGNGNRHAQYLWMTMDPQGHIDVMRALWDSFDEDQKPEWLTREQIDQYAEQMGTGEILESDYDGALITTTDGWHAVKFRVSRDGVVFVEILKKIGDEWRFWFEAGTHKTIESAKRAAKMALSEEGYILSDSDLSKI